MDSQEAKKRVLSDPKFVNLKRFGYRIDRVLERYAREPNGCPDRIIANALMIPEHEVEEVYQQAVRLLRRGMGVRRT